uniref:Uncharacterized protein n=1 Tax=Tanacetum cinerariifolium TaxID=118510 RepID=A0A6L2JXN0_TANCI|nr:hypothetical protein [Tanacetum cinerariifolium]
MRLTINESGASPSFPGSFSQQGCNDCPDLSLDHRFWLFKHMMGNRALLMNFVEKFLETVCFGNNDFTMIDGYGDGLEVAFRKSTCFVQNENDVYLLTGDLSSNLYTIALNEIALNFSNYLLAKASFLQSLLWHQRLSHLNFATINNLVKNNLVRGLPTMKFKKDHLCSACEQEKIHRKHNKSKTDCASNQPLYLLHMDLCGPIRVESINEKRYVLVVVDDYSWYTWVFFLHSKDEASEVIISFIKKIQVNLQLQLKAKEDIGVFVGYSKDSAPFRVYNKRTRKIHESMNGNFDEISEMASKQFNIEPANVAEALKDADWVIAMQDELDQFARLKV